MTKEYDNREALFESIINFSDDAIISKTLDGIITLWNKGAEKIFGYTAKEIVGQHISILVPPDRINEDQDIIEKIKAGTHIEHYETERKKKDGTSIYISLTVSPIKNKQGVITGASKIARDITRQKNAECERTKMIADIVERNKDLEQFSYIISHNLRAPVANILGISDVISDEGVSAEEKTFLLSCVSEAIKKLDDIITDLNHVTQIKQSSNEHKEEVTFSEIVHDITRSISNIISSKGVSIVTDFSDTEQFYSVKSYVYSIFYNLITNSIKYKKPSLPLICEIKSKRKANKLELTFNDNGAGIDLQRTGDQIFEIYKRFHIGAAEGKGMGLFMVKTHVESLGGNISVESEVNSGTTFKIEFPFPDKKQQTLP